MNKVIYNALKLSEYRPLFHALRVLIIGAGAVGSYETEFCAKMGLSPDEVDFDRLTLENSESGRVGLRRFQHLRYREGIEMRCCYCRLRHGGKYGSLSSGRRRNKG